MNESFTSSLQNSFSYISTQTLTEISVFIPRMVGALLILLVGAAVARVCKRVVVKLLEALRVSSLVKNTPIDLFVTNTGVSQKVEDLSGSIVYWLIMLVVIHTSVTVLGLQSLSSVLDKVLGYIPHILSAVLVLFFGLLVSGVVESLVKASIKTIDGQSARLLGKISSYLVITISILAAISELGIAQDFIIILFMGFVATLSLGFGLALGLGGQDLVRKILGNWYERTSAEVNEKSSK